MKLEYSFTFLFVLKVVFSHPATSEIGLQSENNSSSSENNALDTISLAKLDDSLTTTEKRNCDSEGTEIISCVEPFDSANHEDVTEPLFSNPSYPVVENAAEAIENSNNDNSTITLSPENYSTANSDIVNIIDNPLRNLTAYEIYQDKTFAPSNSTYTSDISAGDFQEDLNTDVHEAADLDAVSVIALETTVPKPTTENSVAGVEIIHDDFLPLKNQDVGRSIVIENISLETIDTAN